MTWFVLVPSSVFFAVLSFQLLVAVACAVLDAMDNDAEMSSEQKQAYKDKVEAQFAGLPLDTYVFIRKAAESQRS
jgi:hypothetical protein